MKTRFRIRFFDWVLLGVTSTLSLSCSNPNRASETAQSTIESTRIDAAKTLHNELIAQASNLNQDPAYQLTPDDLAALDAEAVADSDDQIKLKLFTQN